MHLCIGPRVNTKEKRDWKEERGMLLEKQKGNTRQKWGYLYGNWGYLVGDLHGNWGYLIYINVHLHGTFQDRSSRLKKIPENTITMNEA